MASVVSLRKKGKKKKKSCCYCFCYCYQHIQQNTSIKHSWSAGCTLKGHLITSPQSYKTRKRDLYPLWFLQHISAFSSDSCCWHSFSCSLLFFNPASNHNGSKSRTAQMFQPSKSSERWTWSDQSHNIPEYLVRVQKRNCGIRIDWFSWKPLEEQFHPAFTSSFVFSLV